MPKILVVNKNECRQFIIPKARGRLEGGMIFQTFFGVLVLGFLKTRFHVAWRSS
jgi:hypothetical protein